jgi:hypothetical protein
MVNDDLLLVTPGWTDRQASCPARGWQGSLDWVGCALAGSSGLFAKVLWAAISEWRGRLTFAIGSYSLPWIAVRTPSLNAVPAQSHCTAVGAADTNTTCASRSIRVCTLRFSTTSTLLHSKIGGQTPGHRLSTALRPRSGSRSTHLPFCRLNRRVEPFNCNENDSVHAPNGRRSRSETQKSRGGAILLSGKVQTTSRMKSLQDGDASPRTASVSRLAGCGAFRCVACGICPIFLLRLRVPVHVRVIRAWQKFNNPGHSSTPWAKLCD